MSDDWGTKKPCIMYLALEEGRCENYKADAWRMTRYSFQCDVCNIHVCHLSLFMASKGGEVNILLMEKNPAPVDRVSLTLFTGFYTSQVVV